MDDDRCKAKSFLVESVLGCLPCFILLSDLSPGDNIQLTIERDGVFSDCECRMHYN